MITRKDLNNYMFLKDEIKYFENKIGNYRPAEIVIDSVKGSSPHFPYVEHTIKIEGLEQKKDKLSDYFIKLQELKKELEKEEARIEQEINNIPSSEIREIIRYKYIDGFNYIKIMHLMGYNSPDTPRMKINRFLDNKKED